MRTSFPGFPKPIQAPGCSKGHRHPPSACWPNSAGLGCKQGWGGHDRPLLALRAAPWPTLDPEGGFRVSTAPQLHPCAMYTQGTWPPDRRGLMEPRAIRDGLACDRR